MTTNAELEAVARGIIDSNLYMVLDPEGRPDQRTRVTLQF
jgi:hypothetical protein